MLSWQEVGVGSYTPLVVQDRTEVRKTSPGDILHAASPGLLLVLRPPRLQTEAPFRLRPFLGSVPTPAPCTVPTPLPLKSGGTEGNRDYPK